MLIQVGDFCDWVGRDLNGLIDELQTELGRVSPEERAAWQRSLPKLSVLLAKAQDDALHIHLGASSEMAFEYRLPASSSRCDAVLLGRNGDAPAVVILELKDWDLTASAPGPRDTLITHKGSPHLHPSEQVRGYVEYCQMFHSAVVDSNAVVSGCVLFTRKGDLTPYRSAPHHELVKEFPVFNVEADADFLTFLSTRITAPDAAFAAAFVKGTYKQNRSFIAQVARTLKESKAAPYVLLDNQRCGFELCMQAIESVDWSATTRDRRVVIIEGPPGSGKSVIAANLWAALADDPRLKGNVVLTTTSSSQKSNWQRLFASLGKKAAKGAVMPSNQYNPGLSSNWVKEENDKGKKIEVLNWRKNVEYRLTQRENKSPDFTYAVSICDEAHALIDPTADRAEGVPPSGWVMRAGPQAYHIIRSSRVSVFLLDGEQSYRDNETTRSENIKAFAKELGVAEKHIVFVSLADQQFRCAGSKAYVDWLDGTLGLTTPVSVPTTAATSSSDAGEARSYAAAQTQKKGKAVVAGVQDAASSYVALAKVPPTSWRRKGASGGPFVFELVDDPAGLDDALRARIAEKKSACLVSTYTREWVTKGATSPHSLPDKEKDFHLPYSRHGKSLHWSRIWNHVPDADYSLFVQRPEGSPMHKDPLCEVGCPYVVRGFDYDYLGVLWLGDLVWRGNQWMAIHENIHESAWPRTRKAARDARKNPADPAVVRLTQRIARGYRILLSRAVHGVYLWVEDDETRAYLAGLLGETRA